MCGRYGLFHPPEEIREAFDLSEAPDWSPRYNLPPGEEVPVVGKHPEKQQRTARRFRWGLVPSWADDPERFGTNLINARLETADEKPSFRKALDRRRCLIPASGFYEWTEESHPYFFDSPSGEPLALAGLWERWQGDGSTLYSCTILTRPADGSVRDIHHRMPVLLREDDLDGWLDRDIPGNELKEDLLRGESGLSVRRVSDRVNSPSFDQPECIEEVSG